MTANVRASSSGRGRSSYRSFETIRLRRQQERPAGASLRARRPPCSSAAASHAAPRPARSLAARPGRRDCRGPARRGAREGDPPPPSARPARPCGARRRPVSPARRCPPRRGSARRGRGSRPGSRRTGPARRWGRGRPATVSGDASNSQHVDRGGGPGRKVPAAQGQGNRRGPLGAGSKACRAPCVASARPLRKPQLSGHCGHCP